MSIRIRVAALSCIGVAIGAGVLGAGGCVRIQGGAVEVSWVVHSPEGQAINDCSCAKQPIGWVQLSLKGVDGSFPVEMPCPGRAECRFPCQRQTGSTLFDIDPGTSIGGSDPKYEISVTAISVDGVDLGMSVDGGQPSVQAPAPILRKVVAGQPTELEAFLLVAPCGHVNSAGVCTCP